MAQTTRELVLERRKAMSTTGKAGLPGSNSNPAPVRASARLANRATSGRAASTPVSSAGAGNSPSTTSRAASLARRQAMSSGGKASIQSKDRTRGADMPVSSAPAAAPQQPASAPAVSESLVAPAVTVGTPKVNMPLAKAASLARRQAMSAGGKAGISQNGISAAQTASAGNQNLSSRDAAKSLREQRSKTGNTGECVSRPCGPVRPGKGSHTGAAQDASWKVGASETGQGQTVTGSMVGRSPDVTGDEAATCRPITGTEYLGADIFKEFCKTDAAPAAARKVSVTSTSHGNPVSGNRFGRGANVTGNEHGTCQLVTGDEYTSAGQDNGYCGVSAQKSPRILTHTRATKGSGVTGNSVGTSEKVTGDKSGMNRSLTGTQYSQGEASGPMPTKVGVSTTATGGSVTGTMTGRSDAMTGDETGTCKAVTGTPYVGADQAGNYCDSDVASLVAERTRPAHSTPGSTMTGLQPGIGGVMTGANKGACEPLTGTPYVGSDQFADACPSSSAIADSSDSDAPWKQFSVAPPSGGAAHAQGSNGVTGNQYESGHITGPFGLAGGKVTGTEEARFGNDSAPAGQSPMVNSEVEGRVKSRITGEGQDSGLKITGDDWERNEHVTGTEGRSSARRNPTIRAGAVSAMAVEHKRNEELPKPNSKVTGGSGNTDKGSLITYSGGARG